MIHQYKLNGYNIVLDVYSGSVHVVDELAYDVIGMYEEHTPEEITAAMLEKYAASRASKRSRRRASCSRPTCTRTARSTSRTAAPS